MWTHNNKRVAGIHLGLVRIRPDKEPVFYHRLGITLVKDLLCFDVYCTSMFIALVVGCFNMSHMCFTKHLCISQLFYQTIWCFITVLLDFYVIHKCSTKPVRILHVFYQTYLYFTSVFPNLSVFYMYFTKPVCILQMFSQTCLYFTSFFPNLSVFYKCFPKPVCILQVFSQTCLYFTCIFPNLSVFYKCFTKPISIFHVFYQTCLYVTGVLLDPHAVRTLLGAPHPARPHLLVLLHHPRHPFHPGENQRVQGVQTCPLWARQDQGGQPAAV